MGAAIGSFLNVLGLRYSEEKGFKEAFKGRSKCTKCGATLRWYELVPIFSFILLRGKCRTCSEKISWQYIAVEILSGLMPIFVTQAIGFNYLAITWTLIFWTLILIALTDIRLRIVPNYLVLLILFMGSSNIVYRYATDRVNRYGSGLDGIKFLDSYSLIFSFQNEIFNHIASITFALILFGGIYLLSRGSAMGMGDVKLSVALSTLFVWPDIILVLTLPFIIGSIFGVALMSFHKIKFRSAVPFAPFIALGVTLVFFFGYDIVNAYFKLFNIF